MSEREKSPGEYPSLLFLEEKVRLAQWRVDMVCKQVRHEVAKLNGPIEPLGQLVEMRSELTKVTKALQEATEAFVLNRLTHSNARLTNGDFEKLMRHEKQAITLQWELTNHIWYISSSRGDIDKLVSHGLNALQMYKKSSDKHGATKDIRERRTPSPSPSDSESP